ncbi:MAG TPA: VOC family protein [Candidatus Sulfotelmatobacter sp.]|nr:VOC family protein [Candidatus Sulfotelmatobacter sp.]
MNASLLLGIPVLPALDLEATLAFYEANLGFRRHIESEDYAGVERDGIQIHFRLCADPSLPKGSSCRINVSGVDHFYARCEPAGVVPPGGGLEAKPWGFREFSVVDPSGNQVVFAEEIAGWVEE